MWLAPPCSNPLGLRAALALLLGDLGSGALGDMAANLSELKFSRDLESESDKHGLLALKQAGIAPQGMVRFFDKLRKQEGGPRRPPCSPPIRQARTACERCRP